MNVTNLSLGHQTYHQLVKDSVGMIEFIASSDCRKSGRICLFCLYPSVF